MTFIKKTLFPLCPPPVHKTNPDYAELKISLMWQWKCFSLIIEVDPEIIWSEKGVSPSNQK